MAPKAPVGYSALSVRFEAASLFHRPEKHPRCKITLGRLAFVSMFLRRLLLALSPLVLAVCFGEAAQAVGATSGPATHRRDGRNSFIGASPVDLDAAAAADTDVGASRSAYKTGTGSCGRNSARPSSALFCRGGVTEQGPPGPTDYASTLQDQSRPWWTKEKKTNKRGFLPLPRMRNVPSKEKAPNLDKAANTVQETFEDPWPARRSQLSEYLIGGGWIFLAALPAVLLGSRVNSGGAEGVDPNEVEALPPKVKETVSDAASAAASKVESVKRSTSKEVKKSQHGGGRVHAASRAALAQPLVDNAKARAAGIIAFGLVGSSIFLALAKNNVLGADWPIPSVEPWQVLTAVAWAANAGITLIGGRLDGSSEMEPSNAGPVEFFMPASWAFTIWAPIFLGELVFALYQLFPNPSIRGSWWLSDISPWFASAMLFQSLWCASFRPWAKEAGLLWLPAVLLGGVAVALGGAHGVLRDAWFAGDIDVTKYIVAHLPLSLHFGWISCASLANLNKYFANVKSFSNRDKLALSITTVVAAVILGAVITLVREDPVYAGVVAWALWAVGSEAGWRGLKDRVDPGEIRAQELTAKVGSVVALITAAVPLVISLKDANK